jgi:hypothetical protein
MSKKTKIKVFLVMAAVAQLLTFIFKFAFTPPATDLSDFTTGLSVALLLGVLFTWRTLRASGHDSDIKP